MILRILQILLALGLCSLVACASTGPRPGTGDIAFRLRWDGGADLDLHVVDPEGHHISFMIPASPGSKGILDVDCNRSPLDLCEQPIENVYWPTGQAPTGLYEYWVQWFQHVRLPGKDDPGDEDAETEVVSFVLEVLHGRRVVERHRGTVSPERRKGGPFETVYPPGFVVD